MSLKHKKRKRIKNFVIIRDGLQCCYCNIPLTMESLTLEHIVPDSKRGTYNSTNLTIACGPCNNFRGSKPFFEYIKKYNFQPDKIKKYKKLYFNNLKIKVLNIAKEELLKRDSEIPNSLIIEACKILKIKGVDISKFFTLYNFDINLNELTSRSKIKYTFEQIIHLIENDSL
jgi:hypothetical protein